MPSVQLRDFNYLFRTPADVARGLEKTVEPGQKAGYIHVEPLIEVHKEPLVVNPSPFVMASSRATLNLIDRNQVISIASREEAKPSRFYRQDKKR